MHRTTCIAVILLLCAFLMRPSDVEGYSDAQEKQADAIVAKLVSRLPSQHSVQSASFTAGKTKNGMSDFKEKWFNGNSKAIMLYAAPKFVLSNGTQLIGPSWVSVKGHGKTKEIAENQAKAKAQNILDAIMQRLRMRGSNS